MGASLGTSATLLIAGQRAGSGVGVLVLALAKIALRWAPAAVHAVGVPVAGHAVGKFCPYLG
jgi:hypothetical protein